MDSASFNLSVSHSCLNNRSFSNFNRIAFSSGVSIFGTSRIALAKDSASLAVASKVVSEDSKETIDPPPSSSSSSSSSLPFMFLSEPFGPVGNSLSTT